MTNIHFDILCPSFFVKFGTFCPWAHHDLPHQFVVATTVSLPKDHWSHSLGIKNTVHVHIGFSFGGWRGNAWHSHLQSLTGCTWMTSKTNHIQLIPKVCIAISQKWNKQVQPRFGCRSQWLRDDLRSASPSWPNPHSMAVNCPAV